MKLDPERARLYDASELEELKLVDFVVDQGEGTTAVREYLERNRRLSWHALWP